MNGAHKMAPTVEVSMSRHCAHCRSIRRQANTDGIKIVLIAIAVLVVGGVLGVVFN